MKRCLLLSLLALATPFAARAAEITVTDADILPGQNVTWTADNTYILDHWVFVDSLATLTIQPGTVVKGMPGAAENSSALIVCRGGQIFAEGTAQQPIIFTSVSDDLSRTDDIPLETNGLWGGLIILGRATNNLVSGQGHIEGIDPLEPRGWYGGTDDHDNSGVLRYVSIRHAGTEIGAGNEINGLTLGSVGDGTTIEYIEVFNNYDDGIEFFGGTVNTKYVVAAFCGDDSFDWDQGYRGKNQFWFALQGWHEAANRLAEMDGGEDPKDAQPYATPIVYNWTGIGAGAGEAFAENQGLKFREATGGFWSNGIMTDYTGWGVDIENKSAYDSEEQLADGRLAVTNNIFFNIGSGTTWDAIGNNKAYTSAALSANGNRMVDPSLGGISRTNDGKLDPRPASNGPAFEAAHVKTVPADNFFIQTSYVGAFGTDLWIQGWTALDAYGFLPDIPTSVEDNAAPVAFNLGQNFPNPFNPSTTISFAVSAPGAVKLSIYDVTGQKVATLVDGVRSAGTHTAVWNAKGFASGTYLCVLENGGKSFSRKMTLLK